jgi:hypothetical protein
VIACIRPPFLSDFLVFLPACVPVVVCVCPQSLQTSGHPELLERLNKTIGFGMGLEFRESEWQAQRSVIFLSYRSWLQRAQPTWCLHTHECLSVVVFNTSHWYK